MQERIFTKFMGLYPRAVKHYCGMLGWDYNRFKPSISAEGVSHQDEVGMGKSSIRDFVSMSFEEGGNIGITSGHILTALKDYLREENA